MSEYVLAKDLPFAKKGMEVILVKFPYACDPFLGIRDKRLHPKIGYFFVCYEDEIGERVQEGWIEIKKDNHNPAKLLTISQTELDEYTDKNFVVCQ